jgi:hypothetical protein
MSAPNYNMCLTPYQNWVRAMANLVCNQWELMNAPYRLGLSVLDALWSSSMRSTVTPPKPAEPQGLETQALERMRQGLAPPPEIYDVQNRSRIDWTAAPNWARPADPELFEGCGHEG